MAGLPLVAIVAAYNEEDIIGPALAHLVEQGAAVYLLDDGSTDLTVANARQAAGAGLIGVESLPRIERADGTGKAKRLEIHRRQTPRSYSDKHRVIHQPYQ